MSTKKDPQDAGREGVAENPLLHSIDGACRRLSIGRSWLYAEIAAGNVKVAKLGRRTLIPESELRRIAVQALQS
jgi:excisionase family DNA binding protein